MKSITTLFLMFLTTVSSFAEISNTEKTALVKLYNATKGSQWTNKWDLKTPVTSWYGVNIQNDQVIGINLSDNNLSGVLPNELFSLVHLQELNLFKIKL
jgi:mRNA-degrading endonuclease HigB of HigAB toxin-antitoxin module